MNDAGPTVENENREREAAITIELAIVGALAFGASYWLPLNGSGLREGVLLGTFGILAAFALAASGRASDRISEAWGFVAAAATLWFAAEMGRLLVSRVGGSVERQWLVAGVLSLAAYFLLWLAALRILSGNTTIEWTLALLDSAIIALALAAPWYGLVIAPELQATGGVAVLPQLVVPIAAGTVVIVSAMALYASGIEETWAFLGLAALTIGFAGDLLAARHLLSDASLSRALASWEGRALFLWIAAALVFERVRKRQSRLIRPGIMRVIVVIAAFAGTMATAGAVFGGGDTIRALTLAGAASALLVGRFLVHALQKQRDAEQLREALHEQEQLAIMDTLTGLYNRRFFDAALKLELDRSVRSHAEVGLLVCDIDHFKQINDTFGHLVGDDILREVGRRLLTAVRNGDIVARYGGEEFVALLPGGGKSQLREIGERCRLALKEQPFLIPNGDEIQVMISIGGSSWPDDAINARDLFDVADTALYRAKELGRDRIVLGGAALSERGVDIAMNGGAPSHAEPVAAFAFAASPVRGDESAGEPVSADEEGSAVADAEAESVRDEAPERWEHPVSERMARWAETVARALGLDRDASRRCALAAQLRDVGKTVVPEEILAKEGPLSNAEWEIVREHPVHGERFVDLLPGLVGVGRVIREHHERYDGRGYPEGKQRSEISREAGIVACCDAWSAMRSERPYARAMSEREARTELLAGRGTQFDPEIVETFLMFGEADFEEDDQTARDALVSSLAERARESD
jgi:diguanylate cyclase (GGDEF)-like protein